jgi:hypothetical protein
VFTPEAHVLTHHGFWNFSLCFGKVFGLILTLGIIKSIKCVSCFSDENSKKRRKLENGVEMF